MSTWLFQKPVADIDRTDLQRLIDDRTAESDGLEYKQVLRMDDRAVPKGDKPPRNDRWEFLADVSSFANSGGGLILYGVAEKDSRANDLVPIPLDHSDGKQREILQAIQSGIEPPLPGVGVSAVEVEAGKYVLVVRIPRSWNAPHRVKPTGRFYGRNSKGKSELDIPHIRAAFLAGSSAAERLTAWRRHRLNQIQSNQTFVPMEMWRGRRHLVLHLIPLQSADPSAMVDLSRLQERKDALLLPACSSFFVKDEGFYNLEGFCVGMKERSPFGDGPAPNYLQVFRNGCIEVVDGGCLGEGDTIYAGTIERWFFDASAKFVIEGRALSHLDRLLYLQQALGIQPPIFLAVSLLGTSGLRILGKGAYRPIREDVLALPEVQLEDYSCRPEHLRLVFDIIANAAGYPRSACYDEDGRWNGRCS